MRCMLCEATNCKLCDKSILRINQRVWIRVGKERMSGTLKPRRAKELVQAALTRNATTSSTAIARNANTMEAETKGEAQGDLPTWARLLKSFGNAKNLSEGRSVHARIAGSKHRDNIYLANLLVQMYGKCGSLQDARKAFDGISKPNLYSWNIMVQAYAQNGHLEEARRMFDSMPVKDVVSWNSMLSAYNEKGQLEEARSLFDRMSIRDVVSWNAMIAAYAQRGHIVEAKSIFDNMPNPNVVSWTTIVSTYAENGHLKYAKRMFDQMPKRDTVSWTSMVTGYAQRGHLNEAVYLFERMPLWDVVSWNIMVDKCAQKGHLQEAKNLFYRMPEKDLVSWNAMVAALAQNGHLVEARSMFDEMVRRDVVSWNTMITAYAHSGHGKDALELFRLMNLEGLKPDEVTFVGVLVACNHVGLVNESRQQFIAMTREWGIAPTMDHYHCMIDILGRAGRVRDADDLLNNMPFFPDAIGCTTVLGASRIQNDVRHGAQAAKNVFELGAKDSAPFVLLSNTCVTSPTDVAAGCSQ